MLMLTDLVGLDADSYGLGLGILDKVKLGLVIKCGIKCGRFSLYMFEILLPQGMWNSLFCF